MGDNWTRDCVVANYRPTKKSSSTYLLYRGHITLCHGTSFAPYKKAASIFWNVRPRPHDSDFGSNIYPWNHPLVTNIANRVQELDPLQIHYFPDVEID